MKLIKKICAVVIVFTMIIGLVPVVNYSTVSAADTIPDAIGTHEAENATQVNFTKTPETGSYYSTCSGSGIVGVSAGWIGNDKKHISQQVNAPYAGTYNLVLQYCAPKAVEFLIQVNDSEWTYFDEVADVTGHVSPATGGWNAVGTVSTTIELTEGLNTINISGPVVDNSTGTGNYFTVYDSDWNNSSAANLDCFIISEYDDPEMDDTKVKKTGVSLLEEDLIRYRGRTMTSDNAVTFDYTNSGFEFIYNGSGSILANITATGSEKLAVVVDDVLTYQLIDSTTTSLLLAENLTDGTHTVKVYKTQEAMSGLAQLNYLIYDKNATLTPTTTDYNFLFIGASSTCGNQIVAETSEENGYLAFPSIIGRNYNATWQQISCSGRGCTQGTLGESNWTFSQENQLADMYRYQSYFRDKTVMYDTASYTPDVIVTNFNNDFSSTALANGYTKEEVFTHTMEFISELRTTYPNAYIFMCYGNYPNFDSDNVYKNYEIVEDYIATIENYKTTSGDTKIEFVPFPNLVNGASYHATAEEHKYMAEILSEKVSTALNVENPLPQTHFEIEDGTIVNGTDNSKFVQITTWASKFSNNSYAEGLNTTLSEDIAADGSNVKYVSVPVTVSKSGEYKVKLNYGTDGTPVVYIRANQDDWNQLQLASTGNWATVKASDEVTVVLKQGENTIDVTGATNGSYACLDRIDTTFVREVEIEDNPEQNIVISDDLAVEGYQISSGLKGSRVVGSVEPIINGQKVTSWGFVYAITDVEGVTYEVADTDMCVDSTNAYVVTMLSTEEGTLATQVGESSTATYFVRTTLFDYNTSREFTAKYRVRAYAQLEDGTYVYSEISDYTIYDIANGLYQNKMMNNLFGHEYLYEGILKVVDNSYAEVDYNWNNVIWKPTK